LLPGSIIKRLASFSIWLRFTVLLGIFASGAGPAISSRASSAAKGSSGSCSAAGSRRTGETGSPVEGGDGEKRDGHASPVPNASSLSAEVVLLLHVPLSSEELPSAVVEPVWDSAPLADCDIAGS
jgi:hypothetical protein